MKTEEFIEIDWIKKWALYSPENVAVYSVDQDWKVTYAEFHTLINKTAFYLSDHYGVEPGDRVAVLAMNRFEYMVIFFALQRMGSILLPLNYRLAAPEIDFQLEDSGARTLIYEEEFAEKVGHLSFEIEKREFTVFWSGVENSLEQGEFNSIGEFEGCCKILYTSGTTGRPKGAKITNKMLFWNSINTELRLSLVQQDVILNPAPFFHTGGWNVLTLPILHRGGKVVLLNKFDPVQMLALCESEEITLFFGVPTMMGMMADEPTFSSTSFENLRYVVVGGEPMPIPLIETWGKKGVPIRQGYGLTEFGPNVFSLNEQDAIRKKGSVGFANFYIQTKIADDNEHEVPVGEVGELLLKGPVCMEGYWNNPEATQKTIRNGWLKTGDLVRKDEEGYFYIVDRKKDMFISGAENVYPAEVEHVLRAHQDVKEAAVIGVIDEKWGQVGKAYIVTHSGKDITENLKQFCTGQLARFKVPKHFQFLDELPKSDTGKILKRELKKY